MSAFKRRFIGMFLSVAMLVVVACSDDGLVEPRTNLLEVDDQPAFHRSGHAVRAPMKTTAVVELVEQVDPPPAGCLAFFNTIITGHATHLGAFEGVGNTCILDQIAPDPDPPFLPPGPPPYLTAQFSNPRWVLTGQHGDELWIESVEGVAVISLANGALRAKGIQKIVGGTGRFAGATGLVKAMGINEDGLGGDDFRSSGWIRF